MGWVVTCAAGRGRELTLAGQETGPRLGAVPPERLDPRGAGTVGSAAGRPRGSVQPRSLSAPSRPPTSGQVVPTPPRGLEDPTTGWAATSPSQTQTISTSLR